MTGDGVGVVLSLVVEYVCVLVWCSGGGDRDGGGYVNTELLVAESILVWWHTI